MATNFYGGSFFGGGFFGVDASVPGESTQEMPQRRAQAGFVNFTTNLLVTTLAIGAVLPREVVVSPPIQVRAAQQIYQAQNRLPLTAMPFAARESVNPLLKPVVQHQVTQNLLGLTAVTAQPFAQEDWPNPIRSRWFRQAEPLGHRDATETAVVTSPFTPIVWANPSGKAWAQVEQAQSRLALTTVVAAGSPFKQLDWANPIRSKLVPQTDFAQNPFNTLLYVSYYPSDNQWPNPQRGKPPQQPEQVGNRLALTTIVVAGDPFRQTSWPNPLIAKRGEGFIPESLFGTILAPVVDTTTQTRQSVYVQRFVVQQPDQNQYVNQTILLPEGVVPPTPPAVTPPTPAGKSTHKGKRKVVIGDRVYEVDSLKDVEFLLKRIVRQESEVVQTVAPRKTVVVDRMVSAVEPAPAVELPGVPEIDWSVLYRQLQGQDAIYAEILARVIQRQEEEDIEALLLLL